LEASHQPGQAGRSIQNIAIRGDGVAARCCAHLLTDAGFHVALEPVQRPRVPAVMLSEPAVALIRDVFKLPSLFRDLPKIEHRLVAWGDNAEPRQLAHSAVVVSEQALLEGLGTHSEELTPSFQPDFWIYTSGALPNPAAQNQFGSRRASAAQVDFEGNSTCCIESLDDGWLFLVPNARESTWLLGIGAPLKALVERSRVIAPCLNRMDIAPGEFSTCPRIASPPFGPDWLACGTAAMGFDPICGDGTAHALREAILACAVIRAIASGGNSDALFTHYETRLISGMQRHLALCAEFYRGGGTGPWWKTAFDSLLEGLRWCGTRLAAAPEPRFQLRDFELIPRDALQ
jgi:hypothetical protein